MVGAAQSPRAHAFRVAFAAFLAYSCARCSAVIDPDSLQAECGEDTARCCPQGAKFCDGACVSIANPNTGCGNESCNPCNLPDAVADCDSHGQCGIATCRPGYGDCNERFEDGCEVELDTDENNCGICANACQFAQGVGSCSNGQCKLDHCIMGYATCSDWGVTAKFKSGDVTLEVSAGEDCETEISRTDNCGDCGNVCQPDEDCVLTGVADGNGIYECR